MPRAPAMVRREVGEGGQDGGGCRKAEQRAELVDAGQHVPVPHLLADGAAQGAPQPGRNIGPPHQAAPRPPRTTGAPARTHRQSPRFLPVARYGTNRSRQARTSPENHGQNSRRISRNRPTPPTPSSRSPRRGGRSPDAGDTGSFTGAAPGPPPEGRGCTEPTPFARTALSARRPEASPSRRRAQGRPAPPPAPPLPSEINGCTGLPPISCPWPASRCRPQAPPSRRCRGHRPCCPRQRPVPWRYPHEHLDAGNATAHVPAA